MDEKDEIIIEFITKFQGVAFNNQFGVCMNCGGPGYTDEDSPQIFKPKHTPNCLFSRAGIAVLRSKIDLTTITLENARNIIANLNTLLTHD